jgi:hypothetical protein
MVALLVLSSHLRRALQTLDGWLIDSDRDHPARHGKKEQRQVTVVEPVDRRRAERDEICRSGRAAH